jgi:hypothetical protein
MGKNSYISISEALTPQKFVFLFDFANFLFEGLKECV